MTINLDYTKQLWIDWAAQFIKENGYFPRVGAIVRSRHGSPGCYDAMISVWGCTYNFRAACYNAGLCTDYYKAKNWCDLVLRNHVSNKVYKIVRGKSNLTWTDLERIFDSLGFDENGTGRLSV